MSPSLLLAGLLWCSPGVPVDDPATLPPAVPAETMTATTPAPAQAPAGTVSTAAEPVADSVAPSEADIVIRARADSPVDPIASLNAGSFAATQAADRAVIGPAAMAYQRTVPKPARSGIRNFFRNLREPVVAVNFLLQLKPGKAAATAGRFAINTTVGVVGLMDMAKRKPFNLPYRPNGFANSLGYYGVGPGPFLFLPLIGPTTVRDLFGQGVDSAAMPLAIGNVQGPVYAVSATTVKALDRRAEADGTIRAIREHEPDPYVATRAAYLARRQAEIDALHDRPREKEREALPLVGPQDGR